VSVVGALAVAALAASASPDARRARPLPASLVVAQVPAAAGDMSGEGGRLLLVPPGGKPRVLAAGFHSVADPDVSFDGRSILFAAKKAAEDPWCVWEMRADGTGARKITCGAAGARQPVYQSTVYTITPTNVEPWVQVAFVGENPGERNEAGSAANTSLWSCRTDGTALRRLTYNLSNDRDPVILPDGRVVYAGWLRSPGAEPRDRVALVGVNQDGTDYQAYSGGQGLRAKRAPAPTAGGLVVFVESDDVGFDGGGRLAAVSQSRPLHTYRSLSGQADGVFRAPSALPDGTVLVAWQPSSGGRYGIHRLDPATGKRESAFEDPAWHSVQAKLLAPRAVPDARSSVVRDDDPEGKLFSIDVSIQAPGQELPRGTAKTLRVVEGVPATADRPVVRRLLGEVTLAEDGSYQVQVPANTPVQLELLDSGGTPVRTSAWLWVRNHAAQGCVGCHEDPERTPPNRLMKALSAPAPVLNPPPEKRRTVGDALSAMPPTPHQVREFVQSLPAPADTRSIGGPQ
jgi:Tol biopolymer transport system component